MSEIERHCARGNHFAPRSYFRRAGKMYARDCIGCERASKKARKEILPVVRKQQPMKDDASFPGVDIDRIHHTWAGRKR